MMMVSVGEGSNRLSGAGVGAVFVCRWEGVPSESGRREDVDPSLIAHLSLPTFAPGGVKDAVDDAGEISLAVGLEFVCIEGGFVMASSSFGLEPTAAAGPPVPAAFLPLALSAALEGDGARPARTGATAPAPAAGEPDMAYG